MQEDQNTEFKVSWRDEYLKEICAFANSEGGVVFVGVDDNGDVLIHTRSFYILMYSEKSRALPNPFRSKYQMALNLAIRSFFCKA